MPGLGLINYHKKNKQYQWKTLNLSEKKRVIFPDFLNFQILVLHDPTATVRTLIPPTYLRYTGRPKIMYSYYSTLHQERSLHTGWFTIPYLHDVWYTGSHQSPGRGVGDRGALYSPPRTPHDLETLAPRTYDVPGGPTYSLREMSRGDLEIWGRKRVKTGGTNNKIWSKQKNKIEGR